MPQELPWLGQILLPVTFERFDWKALSQIVDQQYYDDWNLKIVWWYSIQYVKL